MKTTIDISDSILTRAKQLAREQNMTLRSLAEEGLRKVIEDRLKKEAHSSNPGYLS